MERTVVVDFEESFEIPLGKFVDQFDVATRFILAHYDYGVWVPDD